MSAKIYTCDTLDLRCEIPIAYHLSSSIRSCRSETKFSPLFISWAHQCSLNLTSVNTITWSYLYLWPLPTKPVLLSDFLWISVVRFVITCTNYTPSSIKKLVWWYYHISIEWLVVILDATTLYKGQIITIISFILKSC